AIHHVRCTCASYALRSPSRHRGYRGDETSVLLLPCSAGIESTKWRAPHMAPHEEDEAMHGTQRGLMAVGAAVVALAVMVTTVTAQSRTSGPFTGVKANTGTVALSMSGKSQVLTLS